MSQSTDKGGYLYAVQNTNKPDLLSPGSRCTDALRYTMHFRRKHAFVYFIHGKKLRHERDPELFLLHGNRLPEERAAGADFAQDTKLRDEREVPSLLAILSVSFESQKLGEQAMSA